MKGRWLRKTTLGLAALTLLALGAALWVLTRPGAPLGPVDMTWRRVQINGDLYVGLDPSYPPFAQWTPDGIQGLEADLARAIGQRLGVETHILIMGYDGLYDALYTGEVDMLIAGLIPDPAREEWVHYSAPYFDAGQALIFRAETPYADMRVLDGKTLTVELASAGDMAARRWARRLHVLHILRVMSPQEAFQAVQEGRADAALVDTVSAAQWLCAYPELARAPTTSVPEPYAIALRKGDFRLVQETERTLAEIAADGTLDALTAQWLGTCSP